MASHEPVALRALERRVERIRVPDDTQFYFVSGMPISDIGKGTFVAHLLSLLPESDAVKFDGLLNTNKNGRHTAVGHDDFGIYEQFNSDRTFGMERYLLGGYLFREFIETYGEYENLCFRPHFYLFAVAKLLEMWDEIGKPRNLIIEIGGTPVDYEVEPYIPPLMRYFKQRFHDRTKNILLTELGWNGEYVKTRSIQRAVEECAQRFIGPDVILAREPKHMPACSHEERKQNEEKIHDQISHRLGFSMPIEHIISVPFYDQDVIASLGCFYAARCQHIFETKQVVCIGTKNQGKVNDWKTYLDGNAYVVNPEALQLDIEVTEGHDSLRENAEKKAIAWAQASGCIAVSDDTGFFINALGGQPGISVKSWGNRFKKELADGELLTHLRKQLRSLEDTSAHFNTVVAVASPSGKVASRAFKTEGSIQKSLFGEAQENGYPLSSVFIAEGRKKTWATMSADERKAWDADVIDWVKETLKNFEADSALPQLRLVRAA